MGNITSLILTDNSISNFNYKYLPSRLTRLDLDNNTLKSFTSADINFFESLIKNTSLKLKLSGNPYQCSCDSEPLFYLVKNRASTLVDGDQVTMDCGEVLVIHRDVWNTERFCTRGLSTVVIVLIAVGCSSCLLSVVLMCLIKSRFIKKDIYQSKPWIVIDTKYSKSSRRCPSLTGGE